MVYLAKAALPPRRPVQKLDIQMFFELPDCFPTIGVAMRKSAAAAANDPKTSMLVSRSLLRTIGFEGCDTRATSGEHARLLIKPCV